MWLLMADSVGVPIAVAVISGGAAWATLASTASSRRRASAIDGFDDFTTQLQERLTRLEEREDLARRELDECLADRIELREQIAELRGTLNTLRRGSE